jgi:hypothetical protein
VRLLHLLAEEGNIRGTSLRVVAIEHENVGLASWQKFSECECASLGKGFPTPETAAEHDHMGASRSLSVEWKNLLITKL